MNATNFATNKDFRKTVDIRQKMRHGKIEKKIYLPPEDFAYGLPNRPPTPFKDVIYNAYGNRAEDVIRNEYDCYIRERSVKNKRPPKVIPRYINPKVEELKRREMEKKAGSLTGYELDYDAYQQTKKNEKPLYKLKMFQDVGSKVAEEVKLFKTYHPYKKRKKNDDGVDYLINKVQGEIQQNQNQNLNHYQSNKNQEQYYPQENYQPPIQNQNLNQYQPNQNQEQYYPHENYQSPIQNPNLNQYQPNQNQDQYYPQEKYQPPIQNQNLNQYQPNQNEHHVNPEGMYEQPIPQ
jgi:hypothetical protein